MKRIAVFYAQLFVVLYILNWPGTGGQNVCPEGCQCEAGMANCSMISTISSPFHHSIINVTIDKAENLMIGANRFGQYTENILIQSSVIEEISPHAFSNMQALKTVSFDRGYIATIRSCAFSFIQSPAVIEFNDMMIKTIAPRAISDMPGLLEIKFVHSTVSHINSYAFFNISTRNFNVIDTEISVLSTSSIHALHNVDYFKFYQVNIPTVHNGAITKVTKIDNVQIEKCSFVNLQCNAMMELRQATPGNHNTFIFTNSSLVCNCSAVPMLQFAQANPNALSDTVVCVKRTNSLTHQHPSLKSLSVPDICPGSEFPSCQTSEPALPVCDGDFPQSLSTVTTKTPTTTVPTSTKQVTLSTASKKSTTPMVHVTDTTPIGGARNPWLATADITFRLLISTFIFLAL